MKKIVIRLVAGLWVVTAATAFAADDTDAVKAVDNAAHTVTLNDGKVYAFPATVDLSKLKAGDKVKVTFSIDAAGKNAATAISPAG